MFYLQDTVYKLLFHVPLKSFNDEQLNIFAIRLRLSSQNVKYRINANWLCWYLGVLWLEVTYMFAVVYRAPHYATLKRIACIDS